MSTLLIIEDDHETRVTLRNTLEAEGYFVFSTANGIDALALLARIKPPRLILVDLIMPLMNGEEFLAYKSQSSEIADIPVVAISAYSKIGVAGADAFLPKPLNLDLLLKTVRDYCSATVE